MNMAFKYPGSNSYAEPAVKHGRTALMLEIKLVRDAVPWAASSVLVIDHATVIHSYDLSSKVQCKDRFTLSKFSLC